jgi:hypothetical protein
VETAVDILNGFMLFRDACPVLILCLHFVLQLFSPVLLNFGRGKASELEGVHATHGSCCSCEKLRN